LITNCFLAITVFCFLAVAHDVRQLRVGDTWAVLSSHQADGDPLEIARVLERKSELVDALSTSYTDAVCALKPPLAPPEGPEATT